MTRLDQLPQNLIDEIENRITTQLSELNPDLDFSQGVLKDIVIRLHSILEAAVRQDLDNILDSLSLKKIEENPELSNPDAVENILSNWGVKRKDGTKAEGFVVIEVNQPTLVALPAGFSFETQGLRFSVESSIIASVNFQNSSVERKLQETADGRWFFTVPVVAEDIGEKYILPPGTPLTPRGALSNFNRSYAAAGFVNGSSVQTNAEMLQELLFGIAVKGLSNRITMSAWLTDYLQSSTVVPQSIVGHGSPEMLRDRNGIVPISTGNKVDWYVRTAQNLTFRQHSVEAVLVSQNFGSKLWSLNLNKNEADGVYKISRVFLPENPGDLNGYMLRSDSRPLDLNDEEVYPEIQTKVESLFTPYQTITITFETPNSVYLSANVGDKHFFTVETVGLPSLRELQKIVSSQDYRHLSADILMRLPIPCFVSVSCTIKSPDPTNVDVEQISLEISKEINRVGFVGQLSSSVVIGAIQRYLDQNSGVSYCHMLGEIYTPEFETLMLDSGVSLNVPNLPSRLITKNTVQFFCDLADIKIKVERL